MHSLKTTLSKMVNMPLNQIGILSLIMVTAFIKSLTLACLDIGILTIYLTELGLVHLPFSYIWSSFVLMIVGYYALVFERRHGYGSVPICSLLLLIFVGLCLWAQYPDFWVLNLLFLFNVGAFGILTSAFWGIASRFIPIQLDSKKFAAVFCAELIGFTVIGWMVNFGTWVVKDILIEALIFMTVFVGILKILIFLSPVPSETFIQKNGGAQDISGYRFVKYLLGYAGLSVIAKGILFFALYHTLLMQNDVVHGLSCLWGLFGTLGLIMVLVLYRSRYLHMIFAGVNVGAIALAIAGIGVLMQFNALVMSGVVLFMLVNHFYLQTFLIMLPRPLSVGRSRHIKAQRLIFAEPLGMALTGAFLFYFYNPIQVGLSLMVMGGLMALMAVILVHLYSCILLESFQRRQWRGGPLILSDDKVLGYLTQLLKSDDANEVIYAIRILGISKHVSFKKNLIKLLRHKDEIVRLFVLDRIEKLYDKGAFYKTIESVFTKDESPIVRSVALSLLITDDYADKGSKGTVKYMRYLSDKSLRSGVMMGLLKNGGDQALLAMDTLQKLAFSKDKKDNLEALRVIENVPLSGLVRLVDPLMKHSDTDIAIQALKTAGAMRHPQLLGAVFDALDDITLQETALYALEKYGKRAFPPLEKMLHSHVVPSMRQKTLILFLDRLSSGEGKQILLRAMAADNQKLRKSVINALINSGIIWIHRSKKNWLNQALRKDLKRVHFELDFIANQTQAPNHEVEESLLFLRRALTEDLNDTRELILLQLQLLKPHPLFVKAIRILLSDKTAQYDMALGVIQDFLPYRLYRQIKPIALLPVKTKETTEEKIVLETTLAKNINELLLHPPFELPVWVKATALYCLRRLGLEEGKQAVMAALDEQNPIVLEAAIWALVRLEKDEAVLHETLLRVPTSRLAGQSLEQILES